MGLAIKALYYAGRYYKIIRIMLKKRLQYSLLTLMILALAGCATTARNPEDPYESYNRAMFKINQKVDQYALLPVARVYDKIMPTPVKTSVTNFFSNIGEIPRIINRILQAKPGLVANNTWRLLINTTVGIGGLFDPASKLGLKRDTTDFGVTLGKWGIKRSPYFIVPIVGPSTIRDGIGFPLNYQFMTIYPHITSKELRFGASALRLVNQRAAALNYQDVVNAQIDPYIFVRNAYTQYRDALIAGATPDDDYFLNNSEYIEDFDEEDVYWEESELDDDYIEPTTLDDVYA